MKDLYKAIGLDRRTDFTSAIKRQLADAEEGGEDVEDAKFVLLDPKRKAAYDHVHGLLTTIAKVRADLDLSESPNWRAADCGDFNQKKTKLEPARRKTMTPSRQRDESAAGAYIGILMIIGVIALGVYFSDSPKKPDSTPAMSVLPSPGPSRAEARQQRAYSRVLARFKSVGKAHDTSGIEAWARRLAERQGATAPFTGVVRRQFMAGVAPLSVITRPGRNYYLKVVGWGTESVVMTAFIRGGQTFETELPLGSYEIRYAAGETWYGELLDFGIDAAYSRCDSRFDFERTSQGYSGYTIELIMQIQGNLDTDPMDPDEF